MNEATCSVLVLQCVAVCCSVLRYATPRVQKELFCASCAVAVCCSVLQCVAVCCSVLRYATPRVQKELFCARSLLQCVAVCCSVMQCVAVSSYSVMQSSRRDNTGTLQHTASHCIVGIPHCHNDSQSSPSTCYSTFPKKCRIEKVLSKKHLL